MSTRLRRALLILSVLSGTVIFAGQQMAFAEVCVQPPTPCNSGLDCEDLPDDECKCKRDAGGTRCTRW